MADKIRINFIAPGLSPDVVPSVFASLDSEPLLAPTHASVDERKRLPYDMTTASSLASKGSVVLWRTKRPTYEGILSARSGARNGLELDYKPAPPNLDLPALFEGVSRVADALQPEFGLVHLYFVGRPEGPVYNNGTHLSGRDMDRCGIANVHARTWFGRYLVKLLGEELFVSLPLATETAWGGFQVDLVSEPWNADFETLLAKQKELVDKLAAAGVLGVFEGPPVRWKPGPRWASPGWVPPRRV